MDWKMEENMKTEIFENIATEIASMEKEQIIDYIKHFHGRFRMDFTEEFLNKLSIDRLRHILMAAIMTNTTTPSA